MGTFEWLVVMGLILSLGIEVWDSYMPKRFKRNRNKKDEYNGR